MNKWALVVIDMVYDFADPKGAVFYPENLNIIPKVNEAIDICRENNGLIIFMQHYHREGKFDTALLRGRKNCIHGTGGDEMIKDLHIDYDKDFIIRKRRYSAFYGTDLDLVLREHGIKNIIFVGTKTNCCIRASVHDSYYLEYNTFVIRDCVATNDENINEVHLQDIDKYFGKVIPLKDLNEVIKGAGENE